MSIARTWSGATRATDSEAYLEYLRQTGLRDYARTPGNQGIVCLRRLEGSRAHFTILTLWKDHRAIEGFAGSADGRALFYPEDDTFLVQGDEMAGHHEVVFSNLPAGLRGAVERLIGWWSDRAAAALPAPRTRERRDITVSPLD